MSRLPDFEGTQGGALLAITRKLRFLVIANSNGKVQEADRSTAYSLTQRALPFVTYRNLLRLRASS